MKTISTLNVSIFLFVIICISGCRNKNANSALDKFDSIISISTSVVVRFNENKYLNEKTLFRVLNKPSSINQLKDLMQQSSSSSACSSYDGTMTFFSDTVKNGYLEFSVNPYCPAFYLHYSNTITQYKISTYCAIFLESVRQGDYH